MDEGTAEPGDATTARAAGFDPRQLAQDWITLWQSELSAAAADRELHETWQTMGQTIAALWGGAAAAMLRGHGDAGFDAMAGGRADGRRPAGAAEPARAAPTAAAPDARDAELDRLSRRVADLERRLAELAGGP